MKVQRALIAVALLKPEKLTETIATVYHMSFAERQEIHTLDLLGPIFSNIFGENQAKEILKKATSDEAKNSLSTKTDEALADGAFGLPWFVATNAKGEKECYWGFDHIAQVTDYLSLERPRGDVGGWRALL
jgi:2-hydroxychromene-2-carboxylate isomerase